MYGQRTGARRRARANRLGARWRRPRASRRRTAQRSPGECRGCDRGVSRAWIAVIQNAALETEEGPVLHRIGPVGWCGFGHRVALVEQPIAPAGARASGVRRRIVDGFHMQVLRCATGTAAPYLKRPPTAANSLSERTMKRLIPLLLFVGATVTIAACQSSSAPHADACSGYILPSGECVDTTHH